MVRSSSSTAPPLLPDRAWPLVCYPPTTSVLKQLEHTEDVRQMTGQLVDWVTAGTSHALLRQVGTRWPRHPQSPSPRPWPQYLVHRVHTVCPSCCFCSRRTAFRTAWQAAAWLCSLVDRDQESAVLGHLCTLCGALWDTVQPVPYVPPEGPLLDLLVACADTGVSSDLVRRVLAFASAESTGAFLAALADRGGISVLVRGLRLDKAAFGQAGALLGRLLVVAPTRTITVSVLLGALIVGAGGGTMAHEGVRPCGCGCGYGALGIGCRAGRPLGTAAALRG